jgi:hypothetical protein
MIAHGLVRPVCVALVLALGLPAGFAQVPQDAANQEKGKTPATSVLPSSLGVSVIEGNHSINSIPLGKSVTPVVEIRDTNEFPVEGAVVVFTMPEQGPGGIFAGNQKIFTTRSDSHGQASAPFLVNAEAGRFEIRVSATAGNRKGGAVVVQTNALGGYIGEEIPKKRWYKKWYIWAAVAAAGATTGIVLATRGDSSPGTVTISVGSPTFGGPR